MGIMIQILVHNKTKSKVINLNYWASLAIFIYYIYVRIPLSVKLICGKIKAIYCSWWDSWRLECEWWDFVCNFWNL